MIGPVRLLTVAAAVLVVVAGGVVDAQTVIVSKAAPGASVEVVVSTAPVGTVKADEAGLARLPIDLVSKAGRPTVDANVLVEVCGAQYRVLIVESVRQAPPRAPACNRFDNANVYVLRSTTSVVVDVGQPTPTVWLRQGPPPVTWLSAQAAAEALAAGHVKRKAPTGLVLFGASGITSFGNAPAQACGSVTCDGSGIRLGFSGGLTAWFTQWAGIEFSYTKPRLMKVSGSGTPYSFTSQLDARVMTMAANVGPAFGPVRLYGQVGTTYTRSYLTMTQTVQDRTVTVDGVAQTVPGGTFTNKLPTEGWSWMTGAAIEVWLGRRTALYFSGGRFTMKGKPFSGEGELDDHLTYALAGLKVAIRR